MFPCHLKLQSSRGVSVWCHSQSFHITTSPCVLPCSEPRKVPQEGWLLCLWGGQQQREPVSRAAPQRGVPGLGLRFIRGCWQHRLLLLTCTYQPTAGRYKTPVYAPANQQTSSRVDASSTALSLLSPCGGKGNSTIAALKLYWNSVEPVGERQGRREGNSCSRASSPATFNAYLAVTATLSNCRHHLQSWESEFMPDEDC